ncbi:probable histone-lysine N-methyltransferase CG1716 [Temnothorax curvispinosus]|uniref:Probable histone-lysine N-methyltransferase CG1716 n=1 Tax=Temnothorax curvispinosus TaxID=300111 RepID=A0A6J1QH87_9HYME|nr:probable histone-lysine N-methyltransferase CG1716 [Temnothorax curvispinosus]
MKSAKKSAKKSPKKSPKKSAKKSVPSSEPRPSTSGGFMDSSAEHRSQEQPDLRKQAFEQHLKTIKETVKRTVKSAVETRISSPPGPSPEQTTKNPSGPVDKPNLTTSTTYGMDSSANLPVNWLDVLKDLQKINKSVIEAVIEAVIEVMESANSPSVPSPQPDPSTLREYDRDSSERRSGKQPDSQVLSSEQTTKDSGDDVDAVLQNIATPKEPFDLDEIDMKFLEETSRRDSTIHSPSVPSSEPGPATAERYDINPSERENDDKTRSGEQPDSQVLSSEQTRKRKGAVDE